MAHNSDQSITGIFKLGPHSGFVNIFGEQKSGFSSVYVPLPQSAGALDGDMVKVAIKQVSKKGLRGEVTEILRRQSRFVTGLVEASGYLRPFNYRLPLIKLVKDDTDRNNVVQAEIIQYPQRHDQLPQGRIVANISTLNSASEFINLVLNEFDIEQEFSPTSTEEERHLSQPQQFEKQRRDCRELLFVTIDGEDAKDFDDAVYLHKTEVGYKLMVAIADVAHFVKPGTAIDHTAQQRGFSVYLPERVIPMLCFKLSNDICSLRPHVDRLCIIAEMDIDQHGHIQKLDLYEALIKNHYRLTYSAVNEFFNARQAPPDWSSDLQSMLSAMRDLSKKMSEMRKTEGMLNIALPSIEIELDEHNEAQAIKLSYANEATKLIENFMIAANTAVAQYCLQRQIPLLYRNHSAPDFRAVQRLAQQLSYYGLRLPNKVDHYALQAILSSAPKPTDAKPQMPDAMISNQISLYVVQSMAQAIYHPVTEGHYGLGLDYYTHFTSPIRRYPDLLLHRALKDYWRRHTEVPEETADYQSIAIDVSSRERRIMEVESRIKRYYQLKLLEASSEQAFDGLVVSASPQGLKISLNNWYLSGQLGKGNLPKGYHFSSKHKVFASGSKKIMPGQKLRVGIAGINVLELELDLYLWQ